MTVLHSWNAYTQPLHDHLPIRSRIITRLLRWLTITRSTPVSTKPHSWLPASLHRSRIGVLLCLVGMVLLQRASPIRRRGRHTLAGMVQRLRGVLVQGFLLGVVGVIGVVGLIGRVGTNAAGHDAAVAVVHLVVVESGAAGHGVVLAQAGLASVDDDVQSGGGDVGCRSDDGECEEGLVDPADADAGRSAPVGCVAGR